MALLFNIAWPLIALCYPLCASIQAIENNSKSGTAKLITYWVCFSLILLFEYAFHQLLEWLPHWPYMKLIIVGCLITPHFNGSIYIYNHLVHPCLSANPHIVFNLFIKLLELMLKQGNPLTEAKREAKVTEPQALQNLVTSKALVEHPKLQQKDIDAEKIKEKNEISATDLVRQTEHDFALPGNVKFAPLKIEEMNAPVGGREQPDLMACNKTPQKEWTCALCQFTATSFADILSHLRGKCHADEQKNIKPMKKQQSEGNVSPAQTSAETLDSKISQALWTCVLCKAKCTRKADLISHFQGQRHAYALESLKAKPDSKYYFRPWTCAICQVILKNKNDLILHLEGKRHSAACEHQKIETKGSAIDDVSSENISKLSSKEPEHEAMDLKSRPVVEVRDCKFWCTICNLSCTGEGNMNQHLNGSKHLAMMAQSCAAATGQH